MHSADSTSRVENPRPQTSPRGKARPVESGNMDGTAAFHLVSSMENEVVTIRDMARLLTMAVEGNTNMEDEQAGALQRLGWLIHDQCETLERKRGDAFHALHGFMKSLSRGQGV